MTQGCFTSSVPTFTKPCTYFPFCDLKLFISFISRQRIWPEARFNALGAFVFLRYVYIEISQVFMMTALKIHIARRGFPFRDRHRSTAK
jgi:hypothetical protein